MERGLRSVRWHSIGFALLPVLLVALVAGSGGRMTAAQDATPVAADAGRPAHIHTGGCGDDLGDVIAPLTNLTAPAGEGLGQEEAVVAETSFTTVPLTLDAILGADHAVNVHLSTEEVGTYIACGELGGPLNENGNLVVGLREVDGSGFTGIAFLAPSATDPASTDVSVFIAEVVGDGVGGEDATEDEADEEAAATPAG